MLHTHSLSNEDSPSASVARSVHFGIAQGTIPKRQCVATLFNDSFLNALQVSQAFKGDADKEAASRYRFSGLNCENVLSIDRLQRVRFD